MKSAQDGRNNHRKIAAFFRTLVSDARKKAHLLPGELVFNAHLLPGGLAFKAHLLPGDLLSKPTRYQVDVISKPTRYQVDLPAQIRLKFQRLSRKHLTAQG